MTSPNRSLPLEPADSWVRRDLALLHATAVLANESDHPLEALGEVVVALRRHQGWAVGHAYVRRTHPVDRLYPVDRSWTCADARRFERLREISRAGRFAPGEGLIGLAAESRTPLWVTNLANGPAPLRFTDGDLGVRSGLFVPVRLGGQSTAPAVLEFLGDATRRRSPSRVRLAAGIAGLLGRVFEREQAIQRLAEHREAAQQKVGRELHDSVSQDLAGITMMAERFCETLESEGSPSAGGMRSLVGHIASVRSRVHALSRGLLPVDVEAEDLDRALQHLAESTRAMHGIECRTERVDSVDTGDSVVANQLARIAQEAMQNAARHGSPNRIELSLAETDSSVVLTVSDDGRGFLTDRPHAGVGLRSMKHRASSIGAELEVESTVGQGTRVRCRWMRPD